MKNRLNFGGSYKSPLETTLQEETEIMAELKAKGDHEAMRNRRDAIVAEGKRKGAQSVPKACKAVEELIRNREGEAGEVIPKGIVEVVLYLCCCFGAGTTVHNRLMQIAAMLAHMATQIAPLIDECGDIVFGDDDGDDKGDLDDLFGKLFGNN